MKPSPNLPVAAILAILLPCPSRDRFWKSCGEKVALFQKYSAGPCHAFMPGAMRLDVPYERMFSRIAHSVAPASFAFWMNSLQIPRPCAREHAQVSARAAHPDPRP